MGAGDGFIAWPGAATDGRKHRAPPRWPRARAACLVEHEGVEAFGFEGDDRIASYAGLKAATGPIAAAFYGNPRPASTLMAVTGTNGKTSTAWWLARGAVVQGRRCGAASPCAVVGTLGIGVPPELTYTGLTDARPGDAAARAARASSTRGFGACAIEASSIGIAERRLDGSADRGGGVHQLHAGPPRLPRQHGRLLAGQGRAVPLARPARGGDQHRRPARRQRWCANLIDAGIGALDVWTVSAGGEPARLDGAATSATTRRACSFTVAEHGTAARSACRPA